MVIACLSCIALGVILGIALTMLLAVEVIEEDNECN